MKAQNPSQILLDDGQYAQGKRVQVIWKNQPNIAQETILRGLDNLRNTQQPGDKIILQCKSVSTKKGELTICEVSLMKDYNYS